MKIESWQHLRSFPKDTILRERDRNGSIKMADMVIIGHERYYTTLKYVQDKSYKKFNISKNDVDRALKYFDIIVISTPRLPQSDHFDKELFQI